MTLAQDPRTHIQCQIASTASAGTARQRAGVGTGDADVEGAWLACLLPSFAARADGGEVQWSR